MDSVALDREARLGGLGMEIYFRRLQCFSGVAGMDHDFLLEKRVIPDTRPMPAPRSAYSASDAGARETALARSSVSRFTGKARYPITLKVGSVQYQGQGGWGREM